MLFSALIVGLIVVLSSWRPSHLLTRTWDYPIITGTLVGIVMGEPIYGMQAAAYINLAYLGWITAGGTMPGNLPVASVFGTAMTILSGAEPSLAVSFAVPFSLFGILTNQLTMSLNAIWVHRAEKLLDKGNISGMRLMNYLPSALLHTLFVGIPAFIMVYFGAKPIQNFLNVIPESFVLALQTVGALMPALGIAMLLSFMGKIKIMPFYFLGFLLTIYLKFDVMAITAMAAVMGVIFYSTGFLDLKPKGKEAQ